MFCILSLLASFSISTGTFWLSSRLSFGRSILSSLLGLHASRPKNSLIFKTLPDSKQFLWDPAHSDVPQPICICSHIYRLRLSCAVVPSCAKRAPWERDASGSGVVSVQKAWGAEHCARWAPGCWQAGEKQLLNHLLEGCWALRSEIFALFW